LYFINNSFVRKILFYSTLLIFFSVIVLFRYQLGEGLDAISMFFLSEPTAEGVVVYQSGFHFFNTENPEEIALISLFSIGLIGAVFGFINLGSKGAKMRNGYLETIVKERTSVLEKKHLELQAQNEDYKGALEHIKEQNEEIETAQQDLLTKNKDFQEALEEIQSQNELLDLERNRLRDAKHIIQDQNRKLLNIARGLDQQVQERTEELSISNNLLKEKNKELDDFVYKSAHDLRGPIARFKGLSALIHLEYQNGDDISTHLDHLQHSANQMDSMLTRLSNVYEISARPISRQNLKVDAVLETVFELLKTEEQYDHLDIMIDNKVKNTVLVDPSLLHLILKNLIGNSIRFYDPLKLQRWIKVDIKQIDNTLNIQVSDNGLGIKLDQQKKIFDLFFVGSEVHKGPGLGLYICKLVTKKLRGSIILNYSNAEKETMFEANVPLGEDLF
jgi:signal transduction histidine kinase